MKAEMYLTNEQLCSISAAIGIACLSGFRAHMPEHAALSRRLAALEKAIGGVAGLAGYRLTEREINAGVLAWGTAMEKMDEMLNDETAQEG